ncbi:phosphate--AMP phosphotransferase [candidate division KSB1 bacterium]|nr:phosphate--AMP phosphotransferase [candidate division KSB1 bacterium]
MLEEIDLTKKLDKIDYKKMIANMEIRLGHVQRQIVTQRIPVIIVFEGWDAAGKGTLINRLLMALDPRGFTVHPTNPPTEDEQLRPFLWRFWTKTPACGRMSIFDRSWYGRVLVERVDKLITKTQWKQSYEEINSFERQLADDGTIIIKFFLHISKKEQKRRFAKLMNNPATAWKVTKIDWQHHRQYNHYAKAIDAMLEKTDTEQVPWTLVEAHDRRYATIKIFDTVITTIEQHLASKKDADVSKNVALPEIRQDAPSLQSVDLSLSLQRDVYNDELKKYQERIRELEHDVYIRRLPVIIVFQGWDAAGKGGCIKRLVQGMDPRGYEVITTAAPNDEEKQHHYLWRFWRTLPKAGHIAIYDRSWYGRVMVERVEGFCSEQEWKRAYGEINEMEQQIASSGAVIIKFWLHIDQDEQLRRFQAREETPYKKWKITEEDWRNREKWDQYELAVNDMLKYTHTKYAPWSVIPANCKLNARIQILKTVIRAIEAKL